MMPLRVTNLEKRYPGFALEKVSFALEPGRITGLVGRNGAGKTTTLKCILGLCRQDGGEIRFWDQAVPDKEKIGYLSGSFDFYPGKKLGAITAVTRKFYKNWDQSAYESYLRQFALDENKTPRQLSQGMKVKYALALALSHGADLLLLDEPTSGLDPVSRGELLELFLQLRDRGTTILFSTHIISDLDRCAEELIYLQQGSVLTQDTFAHFSDQYRLVQSPQPDPRLIGLMREKQGFSGLIAKPDFPNFPQANSTDLETIMLHLEREAEK
jgi:ABC-2 type transport system ATP-binding protein